MRARAMALASCDVAEAFVSAALAKSAIIDAMRIDVLDLLVAGGAWEKAATDFLQLSDHEYLRSPFRDLLEAGRGPRKERVWKLDEQGSWFRDEGCGE